MAMARKICFITGTRADYGIMSGLMQRLRDTPEVQLQIIATGTHLSAEHGMTIDEILADGLRVDARVPMLGADGEPRRTVEAMGVELMGMGKALERLAPNLIVILGDRYEMLAAASAALIFGIPVAHLYGGETTEGAYDDCIRHAITKLSRLHFTSTERYRDRVVAMGEDPTTVEWVGALGADNIAHFKPGTLEELEQSLESELGSDFLLVTFHPVTNEPGEEEIQTNALLQALEGELSRRRVLFTMPNADTGGARVATLIRDWAGRHPGRVVTAASLGRQRYYTALAHCAAVVGNSSSGLVEAPSFSVPTLDIGNRQKGRVFGPTVTHCRSDRDSISAALHRILAPGFRAAMPCFNPYYRPGTLDRIYRVLTTVALPLPLAKPFYDRPAPLL